MILGDTQPTPHHGSRISIDELFRQVASRRPDADRAHRRAEPRVVYRRTAAAPDLCRGRPHGVGDRRTLIPHGFADRYRRWHSIAEHCRECPDYSRCAARGHDRSADAAIVAKRRRSRGNGAGWRQGPDHLRSGRQFRTLPSCHPCRGRCVLDPLCLRLRRRSVRRCRAARRPVHDREARSDPVARPRR